MDRTRSGHHGRRGTRLPRLQRRLPDDPTVEVVAFTATQIPGIADRRYPPELAGPLYPPGIPIVAGERARADHPRRARRHASSSPTATSPTRPSCTRPPGRWPPAPTSRSSGPTGRCSGAAGRSSPWAPPGPAPARARPRATWPRCWPSGASPRSSSATRCPTATSSPSASSASRRYEDLDRYDTTIEEREEYEPHIDAGRVVYAGVDYEAILRQAEDEADVILWDGGNNDFPFYRPDLFVVVADPLRPGDERRYHPGEMNVRMADVVIINKVDSAEPAAIEAVRATIRELNPRAEIVTARSDLTLVGRADRRQAGRRRRGRPDAHPRRHGLRRRGRRRAALRRGPARRSPAGRGRLDPRGPRALPGARAARPGHGLRRRPRSASWRRRSTRSTPTSSCRRRRST